ncbi:TPA: hypothetical protein DIC62_00620 [Candidatus Nomurabacteria bacterium]|nr:hypothetical protein [Candidatus Nomurabacteria bacterium]
MKCNYCGKRIWFWQKSQSIDILGSNPRHYHYLCLFHKLWSSLTDASGYFERTKDSEKSFKIMFELINRI